MKNIAVVLALAAMGLAGGPAVLAAQSPLTSSSIMSEDGGAEGGALLRAPAITNGPQFAAPFSRFAVSAGVSPLGINLQMATNLNRYMNLRGTGSILSLTENNISTNGFNVDAKLNLSSAGTSVDFYPFPAHGLRFTPGVLFYNTNGATGTFTAQGGTSFDLNGYSYYASSSNPVEGKGTVGLHSRNPALTLTTGWGNMIPRRGGHFSFPFELGVAFVGAPTVSVALTSGQVCDAQGQNCVSVVTDPDVKTNLLAQVAKYKNDLDPLKTYPIASFGVAYSFGVRGGRAR